MNNSGLIHIPNKSEGFYVVERIRDGVVVDRREFTNLITNTGLLRMWDVDAASLSSVILVGTGTEAPTFDDTGLSAQRAAASGTVTVGVSNTAPYHAWVRTVATFGAGAASGNISEVAARSSDPLWIFSRALIRDLEGNPTTITVLPDEQLQVTYEHRHYMATGDVTGQFTLTGNLGGTYDFIARPSQVTTFSGNNASWGSNAYGWSMSKPLQHSRGSNVGSTNQVYAGPIGGVTGFPSGASGSASDAGASLVSPGVGRYTVGFGLGNGNIVGGIRSLRKSMGYGIIQFEFDPPIPKTATDILSLTMEQSWGRS